MALRSNLAAERAGGELPTAYAAALRRLSGLTSVPLPRFDTLRGPSAQSATTHSDTTRPFSLASSEDNFPASRRVGSEFGKLCARDYPHLRQKINVVYLAAVANEDQEVPLFCFLDVVYGPAGLARKPFYIDGDRITRIAYNGKVHGFLVAKREDCIQAQAMQRREDVELRGEICVVAFL